MDLVVAALCIVFELVFFCPEQLPIHPSVFPNRFPPNGQIIKVRAAIASGHFARAA
jgi:hypothetical protein